MAIMGRTGANNLIKSAIMAGTGAAGGYDPSGNATGLLPPEAATAFIDMIMDSSDFLKEVTYQQRTSIEGTISNLGISSRNLRKKVEGEDRITGNEVLPAISATPYRTVGITMGTEISNDWFRQNIEREGFEEHFFRLAAEQIGLDVLDLSLNGDESDPDPFLSINDGWLKILKTRVPAAQQIDGATLNGGNFSDEYFYALQKKLPPRYFNQVQFKWICSHVTRLKVSEYLRNRQSAVGDSALVGGVQLNPLHIPFTCPTGFPDDLLLLGDPKQLMVVWTYDVGMIKTVEGKELVAKDNRFYAWFFDMDFIARMPASFALLTHVGEVLYPSPIVVKSVGKKKPATPPEEPETPVSEDE